jgi:hypothetical protein
VHGALRRDDLQALDLLVGEVGGKAQGQAELRRATAFGGRVLDLDLDVAQRPALARRVHLHRRGRTGGEARGEQLLRRGGGVAAAGVDRLVAVQPVLADLDDVPVTADSLG